MPNFNLAPGEIFAWGEDGNCAVNINGLPSQALIGLLEGIRETAEEIQGPVELVVSNSAVEESLGPGAWVVLKLRNTGERIAPEELVFAVTQDTLAREYESLVTGDDPPDENEFPHWEGLSSEQREEFIQTAAHSIYHCNVHEAIRDAVETSSKRLSAGPDGVPTQSDATDDQEQIYSLTRFQFVKRYDAVVESMNVQDPDAHFSRWSDLPQAKQEEILKAVRDLDPSGQALEKLIFNVV